MNGGARLSHITSVIVIFFLSGCGYSSLYNPDRPNIKSFYQSVNDSNSQNLVRANKNSGRLSKVKSHNKHSRHNIKQKPAYVNYYKNFIAKYQKEKLSKVTHTVGDNQFNKKYNQSFYHRLILNPLKNSTVLSSERVWIASIADYQGWFLRGELNKLLHTVKPIGDYKYVLRVSLSDSTSSFSSDIYGVPNRFKYLLYASYSIESFQTGKVVYNAKSQAVTSYTLSRSLTGLTFAEKDAKEKALIYISSKIYTNIIAWLYHNEHQIEVIKPKVVEDMDAIKAKEKTIKDITLYPLPIDVTDK